MSEDREPREDPDQRYPRITGGLAPDRRDKRVVGVDGRDKRLPGDTRGERTIIHDLHPRAASSGTATGQRCIPAARKAVQ